MRYICITGASGYLGSHLCPELVELGYDLIGVDMTPPERPCGEFRQADLKSLDEARRALAGAELLIHCASLHPWKKYTDEQYLDSNVKGTWNVFQAAFEHGINRVVLTSSIAASGYNPDPELCPVDESYQQQALRDIYSITKQFQEQIARHFCEHKGMEVIALRPPNFTPKPPVQNEAALLSGCLMVEDIASAHARAVNAWDRMQNRFEPLFITPTFPYSQQEARQLLDDPKGILDKYYPCAWEWFGKRGVKLHPVMTQYSSERARWVLGGWQPEYTFSRYWAKEIMTEQVADSPGS